MRPRLALVALAVLAAALAAGVGSAGNPFGSASASGLTVLVRLPDGTSSGGPSASTSGSASASGAWAYPADGSAVSVGTGTTGVDRGSGADVEASASAELRDVSLFGGEVTVEHVLAVATASVSSAGADGNFAGSTVEGLVVNGAALPAAANLKVSLGFGYAVVLEQGVQRSEDPGPRYQGTVTGLHVYLTAAHGGLPAGAEILVGSSEAGVEGAARPPAATTGAATTGAATTGAATTGAEGASTEAGPPAATGPTAATAPSQTPAGKEHQRPPSSGAGLPEVVRNPPAGVRPKITGAGHVFPVYGPVSFGDDFAAPRADTGWHHGNDILAPLGTPVLAVAAGTIYSVGWNDLGGQRLWLRDDQGNEYYYAHFSAYSPLAVDGQRVQAGDVIGFVGNTGDARGGPYHLHFEIHPPALLGLGYDGVIDPYQYLSAWYERRDQQFDVTAPAAASTTAPHPAAGLLGGEDISTASGLDPARLDSILGMAPLPTATRGSAYLPPARELAAGVEAGS